MLKNKNERITKTQVQMDFYTIKSNIQLPNSHNKLF